MTGYCIQIEYNIKYVGAVMNGSPNGLGVMSNGCGVEYLVGFAHGQSIGSSKIRWASIKYSRFWANGQMSGKGCAKFST